MLAISLSISIFWVPVIFLIGVILGFIFRSRQIEKCQKRILSLENEMLNNHAEILRLQQDIVTFEKAASMASKTPVVSMKEQVPQQETPETDITKKKSI